MDLKHKVDVSEGRFKSFFKGIFGIGISVQKVNGEAGKKEGKSHTTLGEPMRSPIVIIEDP